MDQPGILPWNIFSGSEYNVHGQFCSEVERQPASSRSWIVDTKGNQIPLLKKVKAAKPASSLDLDSSSSINKRTPPTTPDTYRDYRVSLQWKPSSSSSCPMRCADAYRAIADSPLILLPGGSPDSGGTPLALQNQQCYSESQWPKHGDVNEVSVKEAAKAACNGKYITRMPQKMGKDSEAWEDVHTWRRSGMPLKMRVEWKEGCVLAAGGVAEQEPRRPLGEKGVDGKDGCYELFYNNWRNCNNGGVGGFRQVGCLVYSFSPK
ncbi:hypothetical protein SMACR_09287 [Sordaria macrospora]|uniref:WGS project CABT00000000 data, contig 2.83 n=2 Tax=Sordaria macrospora TaxID=5147 RepID=F7WBS5_SORMK|nr:uncharacterized protein SMAC_09287 [Sordaria macrospora k-hell]KAA8628200.1 hypothetical protein SMACR_09287 [Sordaria macrospora]WPJ65281.1 hypothetical protein SMAC4_09287 [Sordaria macrospora]CCC05490.1 unnamed protein product [Sordaria macrospora k-hell]